MTATASGALLTGSAALDFILAGDARFTLVSLKSGARYTYRVERADDNVWQALLLKAAASGDFGLFENDIQ